MAQSSTLIGILPFHFGDNTNMGELEDPVPGWEIPAFAGITCLITVIHRRSRRIYINLQWRIIKVISRIKRLFASLHFALSDD